MSWIWSLATAEAAGAEAGTEPSVLAVPLPEVIIGTVAFLIVFGVLGKLLLPRIAKALQDREDAIEGGLRRAAEAQAESARLVAAYKEQLAKAREEAAAIRQAAQAERTAIIDEARKEAQAAANQVMATALAQIEAEKAKAVSELRKSVGAMAVDLAGKIVGETLSDDARARAMVDRFINEIEQAAAEAGTP